MTFPTIKSSRQECGKRSDNFFYRPRAFRAGYEDFEKKGIRGCRREKPISKVEVFAAVILAGIFLVVVAGGCREKKEAGSAGFEYPDKPLVTYFNCLNRVEMEAGGDGDLTLEEIAYYGFNSVRMSHNTPEDIFYIEADSKYPSSHDWSRQVTYFEKENGVFSLDEWNDKWFECLGEWAQKLEEKGIVLIYSLFDGAGLKYDAKKVGHFAFGENNNLKWDGGSSEKFFKYEGQWWEKQKEIIARVLEEIGHYENLVLELANEPDTSSGSVVKWHEKMVAHIAEKKAKAGLGHLKIQLNPRWDELSHIGTEYKVVHTQNTSPALTPKVGRDINPHGFGGMPGKSGRSSDTGSWRDGINWYKHLKKAVDHNVSFEVLALEDSREVYAQVKRFMEQKD